MISVEIPGFGLVQLEHAVFDYNGTLAGDGKIRDELKVALRNLTEKVRVHILTADTFGQVRSQLKGEEFQLSILQQGEEAAQKGHYIQKLGPENVICFGNGKNDLLMLRQAKIGVAVLGAEGTHSETLNAADLVVRNIEEGVDLLFNTLRIKATLRF